MYVGFVEKQKQYILAKNYVFSRLLGQPYVRYPAKLLTGYPAKPYLFCYTLNMSLLSNELVVHVLVCTLTYKGPWMTGGFYVQGGCKYMTKILQFKFLPK